MTVARGIEAIVAKSSWIRKMFEEGTRLKAEHGAENVYDFSLGNPNLKPPAVFEIALDDVVKAVKIEGHGYMPNAGYPHVRKAVADFISTEQATEVTADDVIMTCGAAGAMNVILKTILNPGEEVIAPRPFFVEYGHYVENHGGRLTTVPTKPDFALDIDAVAAAIHANTRAVMINSPNNPTGRVYTTDELTALGSMLAEKSRQLGRTIYLLSDEPYRKIVFDGITVPAIFPCYPDAVIATSYSKDISIPGERIGYLAVNPRAAYRKELIAGMTLANRILGFVNAPGLMQRVIARVQGANVDVEAYAQKRRLLCDGLAKCGYEFTRPAGAFYLFPKSPIPDDVAFVGMLQEELILAVPGSGFGGPGHFRIAFCVSDRTITGALPGFQRAIEKARRNK